MIAPADLPDHRGEGYYVYGLAEPDTKRVRYIGRTGNLAIRYKALCGIHGHTNPQNRALADWIEGLASEGKKPGIMVLAHITGHFADSLIGAAETYIIGWWSFTHPGDLLQKQGIQFKRGKPGRQLRFRGKTQCVAAWAKEIGLSRQGLHQRLEKYSVAVALMTPKQRKRKKQLA